MFVTLSLSIAPSNTLFAEWKKEKDEKLWNPYSILHYRITHSLLIEVVNINNQWLCMYALNTVPGMQWVSWRKKRLDKLYLSAAGFKYNSYCFLLIWFEFDGTERQKVWIFKKVNEREEFSMCNEMKNLMGYKMIEINSSNETTEWKFELILFEEKLKTFQSLTLFFRFVIYRFCLIIVGIINSLIIRLNALIVRNCWNFPLSRLSHWWAFPQCGPENPSHAHFLTMNLNIFESHLIWISSTVSNTSTIVNYKDLVSMKVLTAPLR